MKTHRTIISTGIAGHEHTYRFTRNSGLRDYHFHKPPMLTANEWALLGVLVTLLFAVLAP